MRLAVPLPVATCFRCMHPYTWREYSELADDGCTTVKRKGMPPTRITHKQCPCGQRLSVRNFAELDPCLLWMAFEDHQRMYPQSRRRPQLIPENKRDELVLWFRARPFLLTLLVLTLLVLTLGLALAWLALGMWP